MGVMEKLKPSTKTLFVFVDESGNLDFGPKGTNNYVLAAVATTNPILSAKMLQNLKYDYLTSGIDIEFFHASEDRQEIRDTVFAKLNSLGDVIKVHYVHAKKSDIAREDRSPVSFYARLGLALSRFIVEYQSDGFGQVIIVFDKCLHGKEQKAFLKKVKPALKTLGKPYQIFFHRTLSDFNGQIADYFAWSKYVSLERDEQRPLLALATITKDTVNLSEEE